MTTSTTTFRRSIQLFLVDGTPTGLIIASIHGWTGSVLVSTQSTFGRLLGRPEVDRTGIYLLYGLDPEDSLRMRVYIGEADSVRDRISDSAGKRGYWDTAVVAGHILEPTADAQKFRFTRAYAFNSPSAAGSVVLDRNTNGRTRWFLVVSDLTYDEWQKGKASLASGP